MGSSLAVVVLLVVALVGIVGGFITNSVWWFVASLVASVIAGFVLYRSRRSAGAATRGKSERRDKSGDGALPATEARGTSQTGDAEGRPDAPPPAEPVSSVPIAAGAGGVSPADGPAADEVWVIDGRPRYHRGDCDLIGRGESGAGTADKSADRTPAEPVPRSQAVEDGFEPCPVCEPDNAVAPVNWSARPVS